MKKLLCLMCLVFALLGCNQKEAKVLVGTEPTFPPFEFLDKATGEITGFDIELIKAIGADQGFEVEIKNLGFDGLVPAIVSGNIDLAASGMTITQEREKIVSFSDAYINAGLALAVRAGDAEIASVEDLQGKTVGAQIGTTGAIKVKELEDSGKLGKGITYNTIDMAMLDLINGGVDAVINDLPVTKVYIARQPGKVKMVGGVLTSESYGFAMNKKNDELLTKINKGLENLKKNGEYEKLMKKYF